VPCYAAAIVFARRILLIAGLVFAVTVAAQTAPRPDEDCKKRTLMVSVVDSKGKPVLNLDKTAFHFHGEPFIDVVEAKLHRQVPRALLMIDVSGSMMLPDKSAVVRALAEGIISAALPNDPFALVTFSERIGERMDFAASKQTLLTAVEKIGRSTKTRPEDGRRTALYDSLLESLNMFPNAQQNNVIFLISDGGDNKSRASMPELKSQLIDKLPRIFTLILDEANPATNEERGGLHFMLQLSDTTGGRPFRFGTTMPLFNPVTHKWSSDPEGLAAAKSLGEYIYVVSSVYYRLDLTTRVPVKKETRLNLEVESTDGKKLHAFFSRNLQPCGTPAISK